MILQRYWPLLLISSLPLFVALGHDVYLFITDFKGVVSFASLGYIWTQYHQPSYALVFSSDAQEPLVVLDKLLSYSASLVGLVIAIMFPLLVALEYFILRVCFGWIGPMGSAAAAEEVVDARTVLRGKKEKMVYNRK